MNFVLAGSFPRASPIINGGSCSRIKQQSKNYHPSSYAATSWHKNGKIHKEDCVTMSSRHNLKHHYQVIEGGSISQKCERKYVVNATSEESFEYEHQTRDPKNFWDSLKDALDAFYRFVRPYAAVGAVLGATSPSFFAVEKLSDLSLPFFISWFQVVVASIFMCIFHCGLNQLCDIEIDKINKPYLPLASGDMSFRTGVIIVATSLIPIFGLAWMTSSWALFWGLFISVACASGYSINLPLLRWKKSPMLTTISYLIDAALARPLGYFLHMQTHVFKRPTTVPRPLLLYIAWQCVFCVVIALFKDIPDIEGDEKFGIKSMASRLGREKVFWICISILEMTFGVSILLGATYPSLWSKISMGLGQAILALYTWNQAKSVDLKSNASIQSFYMVIWKVMYAEHLLLPLFRWGCCLNDLRKWRCLCHLQEFVKIIIILQILEDILSTFDAELLFCFVNVISPFRFGIISFLGGVHD